MNLAVHFVRKTRSSLILSCFSASPLLYIMLVEWWRGRRELWVEVGRRVGEISQSSLTAE